MSEKKKHDAAPQAQPEEKKKTDGACQEAPVAETQPAQEAPKAESKEPSEFELLQKQYDELGEKHLRILAEYDNYRKRSVREKESVYPQAVASTVERFLPVVDNFERALDCECADPEFKKGMEMILGGLLQALEGLSVVPIGEVGEAFDANLHHAVMHVEDASLGENVVSQVLQKGYRIGERVIRCAMVAVAN